MAFGDIVWVGQRGSLIWFNDTESKWKLKVAGSITSGESNASKTTLLLGTSLWSIRNNKDCPANNELSLTSCSDDEFNCWNGNCIPNHKRCDGVSDCEIDGSDEIQCNKIFTWPSYNNLLSPSTSYTKIDIIFTIKKLLDINGNEGVVRMQYELVYCWSDERIGFTNIDTRKTQSYVCKDANSISIEESNELWIPTLSIADIDLSNRNEHQSPVYCVVKTSNSTPVYYETYQYSYAQISPKRMDSDLKICSAHFYR